MQSLLCDEENGKNASIKNLEVNLESLLEQDVWIFADFFVPLQ